MTKEKKKVLMLVLSTVNPDVRVEKEARFLSSQNFDVTVLGITTPKLNLSLEEKRAGYTIKRVEIKKKLFFKYFEYYKKAKKLIGSTIYDYIHFHDLNALPAISKMKKNGKIFIYDSHENFPEQMSETYGLPALLVYTWVERYFIKKVDFILTPGQTYSNLLEKKYKVKAAVISNYPSIEDVEKGHAIPIPEEFDKKTKFRVVYFGVMYANLGYDVTVEVAKYLRDQFHLTSKDINFLIIGDGAAYEPMKTKIKEEKLTEFFMLTGWMNYHLALSVLRTGDVGLVLFQPGKNNFRRIPNRLYEYFSAGVPFIGSNFEGLREGAAYKKELGYFVDPQSPKEIAEVIMKLFNDNKLLNELKTNAEEAYRSTFNWDSEIKKILNIYTH